MRIAIAGGTGTLGRHLAREIGSRGHEVRVLSRHAPQYRVDLTTGEGLGTALAGCDAVVDASNAPAGKRASKTLVEGSRRLLAAEEEAGVGHHVCVSIVGCDRVGKGYFRIKTAQERVVRDGTVPWSIVRATQFHELVDWLFTRTGRRRVLPAPRVRLQPVSAAEAARAIADVAEQPALRARTEVTGPEAADLRDLARIWRSTTGRSALLLPVPVPGNFGRKLRGGALTAERPDVRGTTTFTNWLTTERGTA